jgi:clan AA aspartic protease (TIGR02281 family)
MSRSSSHLGCYTCLASLLALSLAACTDNRHLTSQSSSSAPQPSVPVSTPSQAPTAQNDREIYQQALDKADGAVAIAGSAPSKEDLAFVAQSLGESVQMLKSIAPTSPQAVLAAKVLPKYERQLASTRQKASSFMASKSRQTSSDASSQAIALPQQNSFSIPISQKLGGVPVIAVTINGSRVPMLLDTGASHTLITQSIADRLQLRASGNSQAKTANGTAIFKVTSIDRIKFGAGERKNVLVAIGQKDLPYGLLGHDVYDGYDITIKENSIEFRKR